MDNQFILNILISLIIGISISYYYLQQFNIKFIFYSFIIFSICFIIFHYLGPKDIESFHSSEEEHCDCPNNDESNGESSGEMNGESSGEMNGESSGEMNGESSGEMNGESSGEMNDESSGEMNDESLGEMNDESLGEMSDENYNQEELLNNQEEYIRQSIEEEEIEEEDNNDSLKKKLAKEKLMSSHHLFHKAISGNNNQFNPGLGVGISPVNIYINGTDVDVDKFKNRKGKYKKNMNKNNNLDSNDCSNNYYKEASRIYNNCDWIKDKKDWCNESYNYDKNCGSTNNLLPCSKVPVTNIPQTLNNLVNTKKTIEKGEPCPLEINKPWSNFKTGDDKEKNEIIPEGFNL